jgi:hypothetical protein
VVAHGDGPMSDDEVDEMIRTAIYLHLDDKHLVPALEWLDERVAVYDACKNLTLLRGPRPSMRMVKPTQAN